VGAAILVGFIQDTKTMLQGMNLGSLQVGTSDAGSYFNNEVLEVCDFGVRRHLSSPSPFFSLRNLFSFGLPIIILFLLALRWLTYIHGSRMSLFRKEQAGHTNSSSRMMWLLLRT
jgi:hypothetical protein